VLVVNSIRTPQSWPVGQNRNQALEMRKDIVAHEHRSGNAANVEVSSGGLAYLGASVPFFGSHQDECDTWIGFV
jgi:hypothetical protein